MVTYKIVYSKRAVSQIPYLKSSKLDRKAKNLIDLIKENPYQTPPTYEKLQGDLKGLYSRRINVKHRLVYQVEEEKVVRILSLWSHYEQGLSNK
ncbi:Txe/YoeB family addiction module toxin [Streptococcus constellatus]|uniref:Txe/YoeB family addiction module toxin n=1 Tax=Streptococcus constellatus TaxID=76860 RepID=UPI0018974468|nr:Txe/YoeB family addiction module toxin [Streptococcus constellatus]